MVDSFKQIHQTLPFWFLRIFGLVWINSYRVLTPWGLIYRWRYQKCDYVTQLLDYPRPSCYLERILHQRYSAGLYLTRKEVAGLESDLRSLIQSYQYLIYETLIEIMIDLSWLQRC